MSLEVLQLVGEFAGFFRMPAVPFDLQRVDLVLLQGFTGLLHALVHNVLVIRLQRLELAYRHVLLAFSVSQLLLRRGL